MSRKFPDDNFLVRPLNGMDEVSFKRSRLHVIRETHNKRC